MKWLPWRFLIRRLARAHGFLDPVALLARLHRFAQPSEINEPVELLRAGLVFHARGLINSRVIQHNLDWVWPYWIERQFDPGDDAFVPRAFTITHVNLTQRNWTAVGLPDVEELPIVDPRGLVTPFLDGWSLDCWVLASDGRRLLPSRAACAEQVLEGDNPTVVTRTRADGLHLETRVSVQPGDGGPVCRLQLRAGAEAEGWAVVGLRPYNPEGISFIQAAELSAQRTAWTVDGTRRVGFSAPADRHHGSDYRAGDVLIHLHELSEQRRLTCDVGMVTAAAMFRLAGGGAREIEVQVPLQPDGAPLPAAPSWAQSLAHHCALQLPDPHFAELYRTAVQTLVLHSPHDVYPGPYTYKRFWFRDAAFIIHALLCAGLFERAERALDRFPARQHANGYFHSQEGEWDSNGEALWIMRRFCELTGRAPKAAWQQAIRRAAHWIGRKRLAGGDAPHAGLLPAGFSAEHLGPNDFYYWDDFWSIAGLESAAWLTAFFDAEQEADLRREAGALRSAVERSLRLVAGRLGRPAMPASPYRRLDSGAVGSLVTAYPLQQCAADDPRALDTVEFLLENCFFNGGFFQDMIHSGINAYLTLHVAQVLLRAGDPRYLDLMDNVAKLASPTGQWPEAIHPRTGGGCMGDGQHVWAAAEWLLMLRNCMVREEGDALLIGGGIARRWLEPGAVIAFGPAPTAYGRLSLRVEVSPVPARVKVSWAGDWHRGPPRIEVRLPGFRPVVCEQDQRSVELPLGGGI